MAMICMRCRLNGTGYITVMGLIHDSSSQVKQKAPTIPPGGTIDALPVAKAACCRCRVKNRSLAVRRESSP
ncbi:hypothetical protein [Sporomusa sphaeroides]|uniref:hypothetical protein n=1 Tax=Sporomusa sphaeroides TaxID=47679 RepID=UPI0011B22DB9|nr:hypothetical protein [Sporomusa sphaeroides]